MTADTRLLENVGFHVATAVCDQDGQPCIVLYVELPDGQGWTFGCILPLDAAAELGELLVCAAGYPPAAVGMTLPARSN